MAMNKRIIALKPLKEEKDGWTVWLAPVLAPKRYTMLCCDCALAHQAQFMISRDKTGKDRVLFRMRRADSYTQAQRAHDAKGTPCETRGGLVSLKKGESFIANEPIFIAVLRNGLKRGKKKDAPSTPPIRPARKDSRQRKRSR